MFDLADLIDDLNDSSEFEEIPVDIDTFMGPGYLEQHGVTLSYYQKEMIEHMTQIYRPETLYHIYPKARAKYLESVTVRETICMVGKGSGKDYCAEIACAYVVYKLMCLKDPAKYFGKPPGDSFDIVNVAINADQARNVFFKGLARMVRKSPWFAGKAVVRQRDISFDKNITVYSGHSEAEAFEGLNLIMCILDEIAGFEHFAGDAEDEGKSPAQALYDMYSASITSRFGRKSGKIVLLSFPRSKGDFISSRYDRVVGEVNPIAKSHTFVHNPKLPIDAPGNSFDIEWTEDDIITYKVESVWALRRPSWEVNPTKDIDDYIEEFYNEPSKSLGKFAAEPQTSTGGFFGNHDEIDQFSNYQNGIDDEGVFLPSFKPKEDVDYFVHVDLARKHDRCVVSMAHVENWKLATSETMGAEDVVPNVKVDLIKYWTPSRDSQVNFIEVRDFIMDLHRAGFHLKTVTFDQWQSEEMINFFNRAGIKADILSVGLAHYTDLKLMISEKRVRAPKNEILRRELKQLFITKNGRNVDHPRTKEGSKDISDAVCGAAYNAAALTPRVEAFEFTVKNADDFREVQDETSKSRGLIDPPPAERGQMPVDLAKYLDLI